jgi:hypothetical protein
MILGAAAGGPASAAEPAKAPAAAAAPAHKASSGEGSLAARLRKVEDRQAIEQLLMGDYPRALDSSDWVAYGKLFADDGQLSAGGPDAKPVTGPAAITAYFVGFGNRPRPAPPPPPAGAPPPPSCPFAPGAHRTEHIVTDLSLHIDGDMATDQAYWETIAVHDCKSVVAGAGHYEDVLKKVHGQWKIYRRAIIDDLPPRAPRPAAP